jgi:hypothetical protein
MKVPIFPRSKKWTLSFGSFLMVGDDANYVIGRPVHEHETAHGSEEKSIFTDN